MYVVRVQGPSDEQLLMEVGRSTQPERHALRQLVLILAGGGGAGLLLAFAGGYLLAGLALRPIRAAIDSQRVFIADASHELRTPLSVVRASAELLKRHASQPVAANRETVDDIIAQSDRLGRLVGQMLTLTRVDAGQAVLSVSEVALDEVVEEVGRSMRLLAAERGISLETNVSGPVRLRGDADRLRELMVILTDNAIKYSDAGGEVRLELRRSSGGKAVVRVSDTGRGIPPEALPRIFDRFYRVDKARSREAGGTGLGPRHRPLDSRGSRWFRSRREHGRRGDYDDSGAARLARLADLKEDEAGCYDGEDGGRVRTDPSWQSTLWDLVLPETSSKRRQEMVKRMVWYPR